MRENLIKNANLTRVWIVDFVVNLLISFFSFDVSMNLLSFFFVCIVDWSSNQVSSSNASIWLDLQVENLDLSLNLSQVQIFDTLEDLSLNQVSNQNVKIWFEFESNFKFRCRVWLDSSKILISWRITLFRDIFDTNYRCFFSELSYFFFSLFHIDQTW